MPAALFSASALYNLSLVGNGLIWGLFSAAHTLIDELGFKFDAHTPVLV